MGPAQQAKGGEGDGKTTNREKEEDPTVIAPSHSTRALRRACLSHIRSDLGAHCPNPSPVTAADPDPDVVAAASGGGLSHQG